MGRKNKNRWGSGVDRESLGNAVDSYIKYRDQLMMLGMAMFKWNFDKVPKDKKGNLNQRFIEWQLYFKGAAVFFEDKDLGGFVCAPVVLGGKFDDNDVPTDRKAYFKNGYHKSLDKSNSVVIYNDYLRKPSCYTVNHYAKALADLENSIDVNCKAQKTPVLIQCDENERLSLEQVYNQYEGNKPVIYGSKDLLQNPVKAISTGAPFVADKIYQIKTQRWNEALTYLGISNVSYQKKERLVSDEVIRNMGGTIASRYTRLEMRRQAMEEVKEMFGIDIEVSYQDDFRQTDDENMIANDSEDNTGNPEPMIVDLRTR
jgi:hypothetical protein